jgi:hypothetical protein
MITWADIVAIQERNQELRCRAEKERQIKQMMAVCKEQDQPIRFGPLRAISHDFIPAQIQKVIDLSG